MANKETGHDQKRNTILTTIETWGSEVHEEEEEAYLLNIRLEWPEMDGENVKAETGLQGRRGGAGERSPSPGFEKLRLLTMGKKTSP
jgi:hypothetical protein